MTPLNSRLGRMLLLLATVSLTACIHLFPIPRKGQRDEAKALGKLMRSLAPDTKSLLDKEHKLANELKITLDESGQTPGEEFREKLSSFAEQFIAIRSRRTQIATTIRQGVWDSPMVAVVQQKTFQMLDDEITRTGTWIRLAQNVRLRAELGREKEFPELIVLSTQLTGFLSLTEQDPLTAQLTALGEEFGISEGEFG